MPRVSCSFKKKRRAARRLENYASGGMGVMIDLTCAVESAYSRDVVAVRCMKVDDEMQSQGRLPGKTRVSRRQHDRGAGNFRRN